MKAFLIYPFGRSDLQHPAASPQPDGDLAARVAVLLETPDPCLRWELGSQHVLECRAGDALLESLPILGDTLSFIESSMRSGEIWLQPILTNQSPQDPWDTIVLRPFLEKLPTLWSSRAITLHVLPPWQVRETPYDYGTMAHIYHDEFYPIYIDFVRRLACTPRYIQVTAGTPAMSFAAGAFGQDPDMQFLYTPKGGRTQALSLFGDNQRRGTDDLVGQLLKRVEWGALGLTLEQPGNGYTPLVGPHPMAESIRRTRALDAWRRCDYREAVAHLDEEDAAEAPLRTLCENLVATQGDPTAVTDWSTVWMWALVDALNRMLISRHLNDQVGFILALYGFNEACLLWGLSRESPGVNFRKEPSSDVQKSLIERTDAVFPTFAGNFRSETGKLQFLLAGRNSHPDGDTFRFWLDTYLLLHWVLNNAVDDIRNYLVHGGVHLPSTLLQERLKQLGITVPGSAMHQLTIVAHAVLSALPSKPDCLWPALQVSDAILESSDSLIVEADALLERREEVIVTWAIARQAAIGTLRAEVEHEMWKHVGLCQARITSDLPTDVCAPLLRKLGEPIAETVDAVHVAHGLVGRKEGDGPYLEALVRHLASVEGPFQLMWKYGAQKTWMPAVREWMEGTPWRERLEQYVTTLKSQWTNARGAQPAKPADRPNGAAPMKSSGPPQTRSDAETRDKRDARRTGKKTTVPHTVMAAAMRQATAQKKIEGKRGRS